MSSGGYLYSRNLIIRVPKNWSLTKPCMITTLLLQSKWLVQRLRVRMRSLGAGGGGGWAVAPWVSPPSPEMAQPPKKRDTPRRPTGTFTIHHEQNRLWALLPCSKQMHFPHGASASGLCSFMVFAVWADVEDFFLPGLCHFRSKKRITEARGCAFHAHLSLRRRLRSTCSVLRNERRYEIRNDRLGPPETQAGKD